jgi:hypothetical protein
VLERPHKAMALKILVAGVTKDERALIESAVKQALGRRAAAEPWTVSLVRVGAQWSVTLNGPGEDFRNVSFAAEDRRLTEAIGEALARGGAAPPPPSSAAPHWGPGPTPTMPSAPTGRPGPAASVPRPAASGLKPGTHACTKCGQAFVVLFEMQPNDSLVMAAVACPHCWEINRVEIGAWAASGRDYRAEKA